FGEGDRLTAVYYFYWYRYRDACIEGICNPQFSRSHIEFATGSFEKSGPSSALTDTPVDLKEMDLTDPAWHRAQIERIASASIDIILPVFWGVPGRYDENGHYQSVWSKVGMEAFAEAMTELKNEGKTVPKVGMFFDTSTLSFESSFNRDNPDAKIDLTASNGKTQFYLTIRDFFSLIPPEDWALWEGHPLVWLYASVYASAFDETLFPETKARFSNEFFGRTPWFVANLDWLGAGADWDYRWGGSIQPTFLSINSIGPGFDNSGAIGEPKGSRVEREREDGKFYRNAWERALRSGAPLTVIETWNELHEGTEICPTVEYGDQYLQMTARYVNQYKNDSDSKPLAGPFMGKASVVWPGTQIETGMTPVNTADGEFRITETADGLLAEMQSSYLYFDVDDSFAFATHDPMEATVEYYDLPDRFGRIFIEYDSWDRDANFHGIYKNSEEIPLTGSFQWKTATVELPSARLANNQN
ncbi:MAG: DUF5010 domain-containing protein, partial [Candidatus Omnitrophica bacterium]|nr:DUF5010 domain-containing protein [Candidatus Omnitrophota bacterium]